MKWYGLYRDGELIKIIKWYGVPKQEDFGVPSLMDAKYEIYTLAIDKWLRLSEV
jgi:hypothetical protein